MGTILADIQERSEIKGERIFRPFPSLSSLRSQAPTDTRVRRFSTGCAYSLKKGKEIFNGMRMQFEKE